MKTKTETVNIGLIQCFSCGDYDELVKLYTPPEEDEELNEPEQESDEIIYEKTEILGENLDAQINIEIQNNDFNETEYIEVEEQDLDEAKYIEVEEQDLDEPKYTEVQNLDIDEIENDNMPGEYLNKDDCEDIENQNLDQVKSLDNLNLKNEDTEFKHIEKPDEIETSMGLLDTRDNEELTPPNIISKNIDICENYPETPTGIKDGVIAKVPIVLAQLNMPVHIKFDINLPETILEIKDIKKSLRATEIRLLQPANVLFIKGYVRNSIKYSTNSSNSLRNYSIDIPFECTTVVDFFREPCNPLYRIDSSFEDNKNKLNQISKEFFNEPPLCKLLSSKIVELNEVIENKNSFTKIKLNMTIKLQLEILQNQNVSIPSIAKVIEK